LGQEQPVSDIPTELNTADVVARVTRSQAGTKKVLQESFKLNAETPKSRRERTTALLSSGAAILVASAAIGGLLVKRLQWTDKRLVALTER